MINLVFGCDVAKICRSLLILSCSALWRSLSWTELFQLGLNLFPDIDELHTIALTVVLKASTNLSGAVDRQGHSVIVLVLLLRVKLLLAAVLTALLTHLSALLSLTRIFFSQNQSIDYKLLRWQSTISFCLRLVMTCLRNTNQTLCIVLRLCLLCLLLHTKYQAFHPLLAVEFKIDFLSTSL